jgi:CBS domain-containing protein
MQVNDLKPWRYHDEHSHRLWNDRDMKVHDVMTHPVVCVKCNSPVVEAAMLMLDNKISGLPVVDDRGHLVGMVTERDLLRSGGIATGEIRPRWLELLTGGIGPVVVPERLRAEKVAHVMTSPAVAVDENAPVDEVVRVFRERDFKRVPVLSEGELVGIVSRADLVRVLAGILRQSSGNEDPAIRARRVEIERQAWAHRMRPLR